MIFPGDNTVKCKTSLWILISILSVLCQPLQSHADSNDKASTSTKSTSTEQNSHNRSDITDKMKREINTLFQEADDKLVSNPDTEKRKLFEYINKLRKNFESNIKKTGNFMHNGNITLIAFTSQATLLRPGGGFEYIPKYTILPSDEKNILFGDMLLSHPNINNFPHAEEVLASLDQVLEELPKEINENKDKLKEMEDKYFEITKKLIEVATALANASGNSKDQKTAKVNKDLIGRFDKLLGDIQKEFDKLKISIDGRQKDIERMERQLKTFKLARDMFQEQISYFKKKFY
jgi:hypothetical protein